MKREELEDAIRHATRVTEQREVLVIGSQAILGSYVQVAPDGPRGALARCLDPHDLCAAKLVRGEAKDIEFVDALVEAGLIDPVSLVRVCRKLPVAETRRDITIKRAQALLPK